VKTGTKLSTMLAGCFIICLVFSAAFTFAKDKGTRSLFSPQAIDNVTETGITEEKSSSRKLQSVRRNKSHRGYRSELDIPIDVLIAYSDANINTIYTFLEDFEDIDNLDSLNIDDNTPSVDDLLDYDVVWTFSSLMYDDPEAWGDNLADYIDQGGALVISQAGLADIDGYMVTGRLLDDGYIPMTTSDQFVGDNTDIGEYDDAHPIMEDYEEAEAYYYVQDPDMHDDAEVVVYTEDETPLIAVLPNIVAINEYLGAMSMFTGDLDLLLHNSLIWAAEGGVEPDATVEGTVTDAETGDAVEGAIVRATAGRDTTDINGDYLLDAVSGEDRGISISKDHYYLLREEIDIEVGENFFDFEIPPLATMTGVITDSETDDVIEGAIITWGEHADTTDEDGIYSLIDLEAGTDTLLIEAEGYFDYEDEEYAVEDGDNEVNFAIDILSGDLTGIITDELTEERISGATVTVTNPETGETYREVMTDDLGEYNAPALHDNVQYLVSVILDGYAPSDTEEVLIHWDRENEQDFELTPIFGMTIQQIQTEAGQIWVSTSGIVTQGTNVTDTEHTSIYIQDDSGWGILVYDDASWDEDDILRGDEVSVIGFVAEEDDMTQIIQFELEVIDHDNELPEPLVESTGDMNLNSVREGTWAQISGQINRDPPDDGTYSLIVNDGSGQCEVRILETTGIDLAEFSADDWGTFTGVIGLSRQGLRIIPNIQEDVSRIAIDPPAELTADQEVIQGDPLQLEVTLSWAHDHLDEWLRFKIYRDDEHIGNTQQNTWSDIIADPDPGNYDTYTFEYGVSAVYDEGETDPAEIEVTWDITSVTERPWSGIPTKWALEAVYPNPFNPLLSAIIALPSKSDLNVRIYSLLGKQVAELANGHYSPGYRKFTFNASELSSGIYFIHAEVPGKMNEVRKVVLLR